MSDEENMSSDEVDLFEDHNFEDLAVVPTDDEEDDQVQIEAGAQDGAENYQKFRPCRHQYLGMTEELRGRTIMDEGELVRIPLLTHSSEMHVALVPGQTLPLTVFDRMELAVIHSAIEKDKIIGILHTRVVPSLIENIQSKRFFGTTAEIYEYYSDEAAGMMSIKAKGRQRFQVMSVSRKSNGVEEALVKILPEIIMPDPLSHIRFPNIQRLNFSHLSPSAEAKRDSCRIKRTKRLRQRSAMLTPWPSWVYDLYDTNHLAKKLITEITTVFQQDVEALNVPSDPQELSYWSAINLPLSEATRLRVLSLHSPTHRLRYMLTVTSQNLKNRFLKCIRCKQVIASMSEIFSMSVEGPHGTFVNQGGYVHEMVTTKKARGITYSGSPSETYSWFPGYAWVTVYCASCHRQIGWKFIASGTKLKPAKFYGILRSAVKAKPLDESRPRELDLII